MTHVVVGYPTLRETGRIVSALAEAGSDFIELQIPFSDPVADGPTIAAANDVALKNGITAQQVLVFVQKVIKKHPQVRFYLMSYLNPILKSGGTKFFEAAAKVGVRGFIIPDLPIEELPEIHTSARKLKLDLVSVLAPNTTDLRIKKIVKRATGFIYCTARLGVTGKQTAFAMDLKHFLSRVRKFTQLPLAVGFGVKEKSDVQAIQKAGGQIAVLGSALIDTYSKGGVKMVGELVASLR